MASSAAPTSLLSFEQVQASSETSLLRVQLNLSRNGSDPEVGSLIIDDGSAAHRFAPLPAPPLAGPTIRMAFAVPLELLARARGMALEIAHELLALPVPTTSNGRPADARGPALAPLEGPDPRVAGNELLARQTEQLREQEAELARTRQQRESERAARLAAETALQSLRAELHQAHGVAEADVRRLEERCAELELHLAEAIRELEAVTSSDREPPVGGSSRGVDRLAG